ncbi:MAG: hypothetical protein ACRYGP_06820 [Janthinobacterium lividum]
MQQHEVPENRLTPELIEYYRKTSLSSSDLWLVAFNVRDSWRQIDQLNIESDDKQIFSEFLEGLYHAIRLAAEPAKTRANAVEKVRTVNQARCWLDDLPRSSVGLDASTMLAAAATVEANRWDPSQAERFDMHHHLAFELRIALSTGPLGELRLSQKNADQLSEEIAVAYENHLALAEDPDASNGASLELRLAVLRLMATPSGSFEDLERKQVILYDYEDFLEPAYLLRPMLEATLSADCLRMTATPKQTAQLMSSLPTETA